MGLALKFISGRYQGGEIVLPEEGELVIGRASELDLVLAEDMVSRKHAKLVVRLDALSIADLGSTNGTFLNGEKIKRAELKLHDRILIGTSILKVIDTTELATGASERADVKAMMERLAERPADSSTMSGDLTEVPLPDLLQLFATNQKSGVLTLSSELRGKIYIKDGHLIYAVVIGELPLSPMKALCRMLLWEGGAFVLDSFDDKIEFAETFNEATESLLIELMRQVDELKRLRPQVPAADATLRWCVPLVPKLSALAKPELDTLQLALNFGLIKDIVDRAVGTDFEAYSSIHKLITQGYLQVA
jgi:pSer/pThr/pTyr-binding forkhead associated (FHA) protein